MPCSSALCSSDISRDSSLTMHHSLDNLFMISSSRHICKLYYYPSIKLESPPVKFYTRIVVRNHHKIAHLPSVLCNMGHPGTPSGLLVASRACGGSLDCCGGSWRPLTANSHHSIPWLAKGRWRFASSMM